METLDDARALSRLMVAIGELAGRRVIALITQMEQPLGLAVGNALEVAEAIATLRGNGPPDFQELVEAVAGEMLLIAGATPDQGAARAQVVAAIGSGAALAKFRQFVVAQGGDGLMVDDPRRLPQAPVMHPVVAPVAGYVQHVDARTVGLTSVALGGGRHRKNDPIDPRVGVMLAAKVGTQVRAGDPLCHIHAADEAAALAAVDALQAAYVIGPQAAAPLPILLDRISVR